MVFRLKQISFLAFAILPLLLSLFLGSERASAQCTTYARVYVNTEQANSNVAGAFGNTDVTNIPNALGSDLTNYSSIAIPSLGATRFQRLKFPQTFSGTVPLHIKLGSLVDLSVLNITIELQAYNNGLPSGTAVTLSSGILLNLLAGQNVNDIVIPAPGANYDAIQVKVVGGLLAAGRIDIYGAYADSPTNVATDCETVADLLTGTTSGLVGALNGVSSPANATDASLATFATLRQNVGAAGDVHLTAIYPNASLAGDSVSIVIQVPGSALLDASVFNKLSVVTYLGNTTVETFPANASLLSVRLLDNVNHIYRFTYPATAAFDRIAVRAGGLVNALATVYIYDIKRIIPKPNVQIDAITLSDKSICEGESTTLSISPIGTCNTYKWYDAPSGGNLLFTGTSYQPNNLTVGIHNYYAATVRDGCTASVAERSMVKITVHPLPTITLGNNPSICLGTLTADLPYTATTENPTAYSINWTVPGLANVVNAPFPTGSLIQIPIPAAALPAVYTGTITVKNGNGCNGSATNFSVTVHPISAAPALTISSN